MLRCVSIEGKKAGEAMIETPGELLADKGVIFYAQPGFKDQQDCSQYQETSTGGKPHCEHRDNG
jgi:hypothetical protein